MTYLSSIANIDLGACFMIKCTADLPSFVLALKSAFFDINKFTSPVFFDIAAKWRAVKPAKIYQLVLLYVKLGSKSYKICSYEFY